MVKDAAFQPLKEKWAAEIWNEPKPRTYSLIENEFGVKNYVKYNLCAQFRSVTLSIFKHDAIYTDKEDKTLTDVISTKLKVNFIFSLYCPCCCNLGLQ